MNSDSPTLAHAIIVILFSGVTTVVSCFIIGNMFGLDAMNFTEMILVASVAIIPLTIIVFVHWSYNYHIPKSKEVDAK